MSEKLKALVEGFFEDTEPSGHEAPVEVIRALPQILAVVKAAEDVTFHGQPAHLYNEWHGSALIRSLIALDEKL